MALVSGAAAQQAPAGTHAGTSPRIPIQTPAPEIAAPSYVLMDFASGRTLAGHGPELQVDPASLTKLMTAYLAFQALREGQISAEDQVLVSEKAWRTPGSRMFIEVDTRVSVENLLQGMIVQSGNDASLALAEHIAGSEEDFVVLMNRQAAALGMSGTRFQNSTGLPAAGHYSTAMDLARLARALIDEFPEHYYRYSQREFTYNEITQHNRNSLLWRDPSVDGMKTGYTRSAGYCQVTSAQRDGLRLISVVLGMANDRLRTSGTQALLEYGFGAFESRRLYAGGQQITTARVRGGEVEDVGLGPAQDLYVTVAHGGHAELSAAMELPDELMAPLPSGAVVGQVRVSLGEQVLASVPLVALQPVNEGGLWQRWSDGLLQWFE